MADKWSVWRNRRGRIKGVAIVHRASDYALALHTSLATEGDRLEYCERLCAKLNGDCVQDWKKSSEGSGNG